MDSVSSACILLSGLYSSCGSMWEVCWGAADVVLHYAAENETISGFRVTLAFISRETMDLLWRVTLYCVDVTSDCQVAENIQLSLQLVKPERAVYRFVFSSCELLSIPFNLQRQEQVFLMAWLLWDECWEPCLIQVPPDLGLSMKTVWVLKWSEGRGFRGGGSRELGAAARLSYGDMSLHRVTTGWMDPHHSQSFLL